MSGGIIMREVEFRVFDLHEGKVLYGNQIPKHGEGLLESIRQFSGQSYELSQYTGMTDLDGKKIYEGDIVDVLSIKILDYKVSYNKIGAGIVRYILGNPTVNFVSHDETYTFLLSDKKHEFRITGNRIENKNI